MLINYFLLIDENVLFGRNNNNKGSILNLA
jgi:hypothetical protein